MRGVTGIVSLLTLLLAFPLSAPPVAAAEALTRHGDSYVVYLPASADFHEVLERLKSELGGQNWEVMGVYHIDSGMKKYGLALENKLVLACKSQYLAQAIGEDPYITLIIPCRFTLFREPSRDGGPGRIVLGVADPVHEAKAMEIKRYKAAEKASQELQAVLETMARFYSGR